MKIKYLNESFELVKPKEETIDTVEIVEETLTEASENLWDKLVNAYPELGDETSVEESVVEEVAETDAIVTEEVITEEKNPWDKLVDMYPELAESVVEESFDEDGNREHCDKCGTPLNDGGTCPECDNCAEDYGNTRNTDESRVEYDDEYDFDNEDDIVTQDRMHAALYGGDREYCDKCGSKLVRDEWGGSCPNCNSKEIFDAKYDDDVSYFDDDTLDEAKEKVSARAKEILSPLTMSQAIKAAREVLADNPDCDGVCYGIDNDYFQPYCITFDEAQRIAIKQKPSVLWNRNK